MAAGTLTNFILRQEEFNAGLVEAIDQRVNAFNAQSRGTIVLETQRIQGDFASTRFFNRVAGLIQRRDATSLADVTDLSVDQGERIDPKLKRRIGPLAHTLDSLAAIGADESTISFVLGQQLGEEMPQEYLNTVLLAGTAALSQETGPGGLVYDGTAATIDHAGLIGGLALMGDMAQGIRAWVMHSKPFYDLMAGSLTEASGNLAEMTVYEGVAGTINRPVFVTDSPSLVVADGVAAGVNKYRTLGLTEGALRAGEAEGRRMVSEVVTGKENLIVRFQGEEAYTVGVKGYGWDKANGGANPDDAALGTPSNWDELYPSNKQKAGIMLETR